MFLLFYLGEFALVEGVVAGLSTVKSPNEIRINTSDGRTPSCLQTTQFEELLATAYRLEKTHTNLWVADSDHTDIALFGELANSAFK
ncbi:hypothetical protein A2G06_16895 (plasmid) [Geobacter anodireducens]|nr:hypothetical protein A2G06_16895 [Geobacter anodireducens]